MERKEARKSGIGDEGQDDAKEKEKAYKRSLWPPGSDMSNYTYDEALYWFVTPDRIWWYRPDQTLWYDCRNESYFTYDSALSDYVSVNKDVATLAIQEGRSCAPHDVAAAAAAKEAEDTAAAVLQAKQEEARAAEEERLRLQAQAEAAAEAERNGGSLETETAVPATPFPEDAARSSMEVEDLVADKLRAHTESWQGKKDSQEDRYIEAVRVGKLGTMFGVFDGHGGVQAAEYSCKHLPRNVLRCYQQREGRKDTVDVRKLISAMDESFPLTDRELLEVARRKKYNDGTTALLLLVVGTQLESLSLFLSHVGDCRAVLCRDGIAVRLTQDHRPDRKDEQKRIKEAGGGVFQVAGIWRCTTAAGAARALDARAGFKDGESHLYLSCSRSLGDPDMKLNPDRPILSNMPETSVHKLQPEDLFVVLACDGVWDVIRDQQACDLVLNHWGEPAAAAASIVRTALSSGSGDNLTAQVVMFSWRAELGSAVALRRAEQKLQEAADAKKPVAKAKVVEEDIDMFA